MIFVDPLLNHGGSVTFRWKSSCHLYSDGRLTELNAFARSIGMRESWFQDQHIDLPHYDLTAQRRKAAISLGAVEHTKKELVQFMRHRRALATRIMESTQDDILLKRKTRQMVISASIADMEKMVSDLEEFPDAPVMISL